HTSQVNSAIWPSDSGLTAFGVRVIDSLPPLATSQAQPLPNWPTAAALKSSLNLARPPRSRSIAWATLPVGLPPPCGFMQFQKKVWFHTCAALLKMPALEASLALAWTISSSDWFSIGEPLTRLFRLVT